MKTEEFIRHRYGPLPRYLWGLLQTHGVLTVGEIAKATPVGRGCMGGNHHRQRIATALWRMEKNGDIYKVGRAQYSVRRNDRKKKFTLPEQLFHYLKKHGKVHFKDIAQAFRPRTDASVRGGLLRLRAKTKADNDGMEWYPVVNVVDLKERLKSKKPWEEEQKPPYPPGEQRYRMETPKGETLLQVYEGAIVGVEGPQQWLVGQSWADVKPFLDHQGWTCVVDGEIASG